ncbi:hypothetical protein DPMN_016205 [Dreissena polymorpha]|uniref:Uncharacterized protein n=1 Tax=Dreissena polymorpha TaxID=45954 RepID=A0A9D4S6B4_DREPO|nr:hypothetical protein DPMN_016205 [Dreissena polymorpha]
MASLAIPAGPLEAPTVDTEARPYTLNVESALIKKLKAARRNILLEIHHKRGNLVIDADLATFELLKCAMLQYYSIRGPNRSIDIKKVYDNKRIAITEYIICVLGNDCTEHSYTLNIYPTTSRCLVNGKGMQGFIDAGLPKLQSMLQDAQSTCGNSFEYINRTLQSEIEKALNKNSEKPSDTCRGCNKKCKSRSTLCTYGNHWIHYRCENLTEFEISYNEDKDNKNKQYKCKLCVSSLPALAPPPSFVLTCAQDILDEELGDRCVACDTIIMDNSEACDSCMGTCHMACVYKNGGSVICNLCAANQSQIYMTSGKPHNNTASPRHDADNSRGVATTHSEHNSIDQSASHPGCSSPASTTASPAGWKSIRSHQQSVPTQNCDKCLRSDEISAKEIKLTKWESELKSKIKRWTTPKRQY